VPRFNERFLLSLAACPAALILDDELNVLNVLPPAQVKNVQYLNFSGSNPSTLCVR
jgi:N-acetyltransferase 10